MAVKKIIVSTVDTRKFVEYMLYLGSVGGKITKKCKALKGMFMRAEVEVPADTIIKQTPEMKVAAGPEYEDTEGVVQEEDSTESKKPVAKKTARKTTSKKVEDVELSEDGEKDVE